jgi:hypothetical protein
MAATYPKPNKKPRWGTTTSHVTEPSEGKKDLGWEFEELPPSDVENWRTHNVETWFDWIDERIFDGASADELLFKSPGNASDAFKITDTANRSIKNLVPDSDNLYDLGSSSLEWKNLYIDGTARIDTLILSTTASEGVSSDILPAADGAYDLGASGREWQNLHIDGTANIDKLTLSTTASEGVDSDMVPAADGTYDLGSVSYEWQDLFLDGTATIDTLVVSTTAGEGVGSALIPTTDDTYDLGSASYEWQDLFLDGTATIDTLVLSTTAGEGVGSSLIPTTNNTYNLGSLLYQWDHLWTYGATITTSISTPRLASAGTDLEVFVSGAMYPQSDTAMSLGDATHRWDDNHMWGLTLYNAYPLVLDDDTTPSHPDTTRPKGTIAWDSSYLYVKTAATDGWKRVAISAIPP